MKAVNLYLLTRQVEPEILSDYEYALSGRDKAIRCRTEEIDMMSMIVDQFARCGAAPYMYDGWFYSFTIPQIGKEFDMLRISDDIVINIELKSQPVELKKVEKQLYQNRYYLGHLNKKIYSFTLIRDYQSLRVLKYEDGIRYSSFDEILGRIGKDYYAGSIEQLFDPCFYLVSPINTPDRFLSKEYFLNNQQAAIRKTIMEAGRDRHLFGIKGPAGTGKTLLLFDLAFAYGETERTCIIHSGILTEGHAYLKEHADRVDFYAAKSVSPEILENYDVICVDETQRLYSTVLDMILEAAGQGAKRCIFSYDFSQALSKSEIKRNNPKRLSQIAGFEEYKLSDRIRTNNEINSFIRNMLRLYDLPKRKMTYENVDVICANDLHEALVVLRMFVSRGYKFISLIPSQVEGSGNDYAHAANSHQVIGREYDKVVVILDSNFLYNKFGELTGKEHPNPDYLFSRLFYQNVTRARVKLCLVVLQNPDVFRKLIKIKNNRLIYEARQKSTTSAGAAGPHGRK